MVIDPTLLYTLIYLHASIYTSPLISSSFVQLTHNRSSNSSPEVRFSSDVPSFLNSSGLYRSNSDIANRLAATKASTNRTNSSVSRYIDKSYFDNLPFGAHSHWLQPWRAYLETVPATTFLNGVGIQLDLNDRENPNLVLQMLANHGIQTVRIEIGWSNLSYDLETLQHDRLQTILKACKRWGVRHSRER